MNDLSEHYKYKRLWTGIDEWLTYCFLLFIYMTAPILLIIVVPFAFIMIYTSYENLNMIETQMGIKQKKFFIW